MKSPGTPGHKALTIVRLTWQPQSNDLIDILLVRPLFLLTPTRIIKKVAFDNFQTNIETTQSFSFYRYLFLVTLPSNLPSTNYTVHVLASVHHRIK